MDITLAHILFYLAGLFTLPGLFLIAFFFDRGTGVTDDPVKLEITDALAKALRNKNPNTSPQ